MSASSDPSSPASSTNAKKFRRGQISFADLFLHCKFQDEETNCDRQFRVFCVEQLGDTSDLNAASDPRSLAHLLKKPECFAKIKDLTTVPVAKLVRSYFFSKDTKIRAAIDDLIDCMGMCRRRVLCCLNNWSLDIFRDRNSTTIRAESALVKQIMPKHYRDLPFESFRRLDTYEVILCVLDNSSCKKYLEEMPRIRRLILQEVIREAVLNVEDDRCQRFVRMESKPFVISCMTPEFVHELITSLEIEDEGVMLERLQMIKKMIDRDQVFTKNIEQILYGADGIPEEFFSALWAEWGNVTPGTPEYFGRALASFLFQKPDKKAATLKFFKSFSEHGRDLSGMQVEIIDACKRSPEYIIPTLWDTFPSFVLDDNDGGEKAKPSTTHTIILEDRSYLNIGDMVIDVPAGFTVLQLYKLLSLIVGPRILSIYMYGVIWSFLALDRSLDGVSKIMLSVSAPSEIVSMLQELLTRLNVVIRSPLE